MPWERCRRAYVRGRYLLEDPEQNWRAHRGAKTQYHLRKNDQEEARSETWKVGKLELHHPDQVMTWKLLKTRLRHPQR